MTCGLRVVVGIGLTCAVLFSLSCRSTRVRNPAEEPERDDRHALPLPAIETLGHSPDRLTDALISMQSGAVVAQGFVAPAKRLETLEVVATPHIPAEHMSPLFVEIRSPDLSERFGYGHIPAATMSGETSSWGSVVWDERAELEPGSEYRVVVFTGPDHDWIVGASTADTYAGGTLFSDEADRDTESAPADLAMRLSFASGDVVESGIDDPGRYAQVHSIDGHRGCRYGLYGHPAAADERAEFHRHLPQCMGERCVDYYDQLLEDADERASRAAGRFDAVDEFRLSLQSSNPTVGISCDDACAVYDFASCRATTVRVDLPQGDASYYRRGACGDPISAQGPASYVGCLCSDDPRSPETALTNAADVDEMVTSSFRRLRDGTIERKQDATPFGVTCRQVCEVLGADGCSSERCDETVTPWSRTCEPCEDQGALARRAANRTTLVAGAYFVVPRDGSYFVVDHDGAVRRMVDLKPVEGRELRAAGPFVVREPQRGADGSVETVDLRDLSHRTFGQVGEWCRYGFDGRLLRSCTTPRHRQWEVLLQPLIPRGKSVALPALDRQLHVRSFDGKTFVGVDDWGYPYRWKVGSRDVEKLDRPPQRGQGYSYRVRKELDALFKTNPSAFVDSIFFAAWDGHVWGYDAKTKSALAWQDPNWKRGGHPEFQPTVEDGLVRIDDYVFHSGSNTFRHADIAAIAWAGKRALSDNCPQNVESAAVEAPLDDLCIVKVDPATVPYGRVLSPVEAKPKY